MMGAKTRCSCAFNALLATILASALTSCATASQYTTTENLTGYVAVSGAMILLFDTEKAMKDSQGDPNAEWTCKVVASNERLFRELASEEGSEVSVMAQNLGPSLHEDYLGIAETLSDSYLRYRGRMLHFPCENTDLYWATRRLPPR
jgi:hypothetical protein